MGPFMNRRAIAAALAMCWLGSCAGNIDPNDQQAVDAQRAAASQAYFDCLSKAADKYDDGKSVIDDVAAKIASQCGNAYLAMKATMDADLGGDARVKFDSDMDAARLTNVQDAVIRHRQSGVSRTVPGSS